MSSNIGKAVSPETVKAFLVTNPEFLESYVTSTAVPSEMLTKWCQKKTRTPSIGHPASSTAVHNTGLGRPNVKTTAAMDDWEIGNHAQKRRLLLDLSFSGKSMDGCGSNGDGAVSTGQEAALQHQLTGSCVRAVDASGAHFYAYDYELEEFFYNYSYQSPLSTTAGGCPNPSQQSFKAGIGVTIAAFTAQSERPVRSDDLSKELRFPDSVVKGIGPIMCHPLIDANSSFIGVLELYRMEGMPPFSDKDEEVFVAMNRQRKLNDFLLNVAKSIFQDIVSMDTVIMKVMNFAQKLVNADRASLFLVDNKSNELYARIFDVGTGEDEHLNIDGRGEREIRFPMDRGIAGHVAATGEILNIDNAYNDDRFNREVDLKTGYKTKTILCMPIYIRGSIIGVVQMVNKHGGVFTKQDEEAFETFAIYCGLALHHAKLYDKIRRSEQKHRVALEVLAYHSVCNRDEFNKLKKHTLPHRIPEIESFALHPLKLTELQKPLYAVFMYKSLFGNASW